MNSSALNIAKTVALAVLFSVQVQSQQPPVRVGLLEAAEHCVKRAEAEPVTTAYANYVHVEIVVGVDGSVEAVKVLKGNQSHVASAIAAAKQY